MSSTVWFFVGVLTGALCCLGCLALIQGGLYSRLDIVYPDNTLEEAVGLPMTLLCNARQREPELLDGETRIVGMYVSLYDLIVRHHHNRISDGFQIRLIAHLFLFIQRIVQHNDELGTVTEFDILLRLLGDFHEFTTCLSALDGVVNLLAEKRVISAL